MVEVTNGPVSTLPDGVSETADVIKDIGLADVSHEYVFFLPPIAFALAIKFAEAVLAEVGVRIVDELFGEKNQLNLEKMFEQMISAIQGIIRAELEAKALSDLYAHAFAINTLYDEYRYTRDSSNLNNLGNFIAFAVADAQQLKLSAVSVFSVVASLQLVVAIEKATIASDRDLKQRSLKYVGFLSKKILDQADTYEPLLKQRVESRYSAPIFLGFSWGFFKDGVINPKQGVRKEDIEKFIEKSKSDDFDFWSKSIIAPLKECRIKWEDIYNKYK